MPGSAAERPSENITQLGFDSLAIVPANEVSEVSVRKSASTATFGMPEVYRSAPQSRRRTKKRAALPIVYQQATFDDLFAILSADAAIPRVITTTEGTQKDKKRRGHKQDDSNTQFDLWSLAEVSTDNVRAVPEREPAGSGTGSNSAAVQRSDVRASGSEEDGLFSSLGDSNRSV